MLSNVVMRNALEDASNGTPLITATPVGISVNCQMVNALKSARVIYMR